MLIQDQVTVFKWLLYVKYDALRLARWLTLQHYFGTTLIKVADPWYRGYTGHILTFIKLALQSLT
jgi:hypothetical protein